MMLTVPEVAARLRESRYTTLRRLRSADLRGSKVGKQWLVSEADLEAFLAATANVKQVERRRRRR